MLVATIVVLVLIIRAFYLNAKVGRVALIRSSGNWLLRAELRRSVYMEQIPAYVSQFPVPREVRMRVLRIAGAVVWHETESIALPDEACTHLGDISILEYDEQFPRWARISATGRGGVEIERGVNRKSGQ